MRPTLAALSLLGRRGTNRSAATSLDDHGASHRCFLLGSQRAVHARGATISDSQSAGVAGGFLRVPTDFTLLCLAQTDDVRLIATLCVSHVHDDAIKPSEQVDPPLAMSFTRIFPTDDGAIVALLGSTGGRRKEDLPRYPRRTRH